MTLSRLLERLGPDADHLVFNDPSDECGHGRLPGDPTRPCGCWPSELPLQRRRARGQNRGRYPKLEPAQVDAIRANPDGAPVIELARRHGVSPDTVKAARDGHGAYREAA